MINTILERAGWQRIRLGYFILRDIPGVRVKLTPQTIRFETRRHSTKRRSGVWEVKTIIHKPTNYRGFAGTIKRIARETIADRFKPEQFNWNNGMGQRYHGARPVKRAAGNGKCRGLPRRRDTLGW